MLQAEGIDIRRVDRVGRITLNRPKALNALTYDMALAMEAALDDWSDHGAVDAVVIDAVGDKAFCAGGDLSQLYKRGCDGDYAYGRDFWRDEYRLNAKIANYPVPYVALMDGIVMGGGVGISAHGSPRIATERSMIAMPECGIGLVPDVGGTRLLANAAGHLGEFFAMTGWRMNAGDALQSGFADRFIASDKLPSLIETIEKDGSLECLSGSSDETPEPSLAPYRDAIDKHFSHGTALECLHALEADETEFASKAAAMIRKACPLSVACAFAMLRAARELETIEDALRLEYRFTFRSMSDGDFLEGIRALIVEKDRSPKWRTSRLEDIRSEQVEAMLAPLGEHELIFERRRSA